MLCLHQLILRHPAFSDAILTSLVATHIQQDKAVERTSKGERKTNLENPQTLTMCNCKMQTVKVLLYSATCRVYYSSNYPNILYLNSANIFAF